jgi:hypothetical protein
VVKLERARARAARRPNLDGRNDEIKNTSQTVRRPSGEGGGGGDGEDKKKDAPCAWTLKDANQKDKIMKECAELYHKHFEQDLDEKTHLIGSTASSTSSAPSMRAGRGYMVSMCTASTSWSRDDQPDRDRRLLQGVSRRRAARSTPLGRLASFISGDVQREEFLHLQRQRQQRQVQERTRLSEVVQYVNCRSSLVTQQRRGGGDTQASCAHAGRRSVCSRSRRARPLNVGIVMSVWR